jgi:TonB family protein
MIARIHELRKFPAPAPIVNPKIEPPIIKQLPPEPPKLVAFKSSIPELPKPVVVKKIAEGVFDSGSSAAPTVQARVHDVQTGGFGDPNGVAGKSNTERKVTVASAGGFDLPSGSGNGNGDAGSHGQRGVVASSGFGTSIAGSGSGSGNARTAVNTGGFGDAANASAQTAARRTAAPEVTPVAILFKPKPVYTAEAREMHIEGEVLLAVMFSAAGDVRVLRVVRGLGHGLDEAAEIAGQKIRFEPAKKDGRPYDSDAVVHIVFELAE